MLFEDIQPGWVNRVVADFGRYPLAPCVEVVVEPVPNERVQVHRLFLRYGPGPGLRPASLILKTPVGPTLSGGAAAPHDAGAREAFFFRMLAPRSALPTTACFAVAADPDSRSSAILLEDLTLRGLRQGNRAAGIRRSEAEMVLRALAVFHATRWDRTQELEMRQLDALTRAVTTAGDEAVADYYREAWPALEACGLYEIAPDVGRLGRALLADPSWARRRLARRPQTLVQGDLHVENLFFNDSLEPPGVALIDWEDVALGNGLLDVAWLIATSVHTRDVEWEPELVRTYHEALVAAGIRDYRWEECQVDYRLAVENVFVQGVLNSAVERAGSDAEWADEHELGQRYLWACQRARPWELRSATTL